MLLCVDTGFCMACGCVAPCGPTISTKINENPCVWLALDSVGVCSRHLSVASTPGRLASAQKGALTPVLGDVLRTRQPDASPRERGLHLDGRARPFGARACLVRKSAGSRGPPHLKEHCVQPRRVEIGLQARTSRQVTNIECSLNSTSVSHGGTV